MKTGNLSGAEKFPRALRLQFFVAVVAVLIAASFIWYEATRRESIFYLSSEGRAEWILCPKPREAGGPGAVELRAVFRRAFHLDESPGNASIRLRAFKAAMVTVNGQAVPLPSCRNWKDIIVTNVSSLQKGRNEIEVTAVNEMGPPAIWLELTAGGFQLSSDESWLAAFVGSDWQTARLASKPMPTGEGNALSGGETIWSAWQTAWPPFLVLVGITVAALVGLRIWKRKGNKSDAQFVRVVLGGSVLLWAILLVHNAPLLRRAIGFDAQPHLDYIQFILDHGSIPLASQGSAMYNPPLYHLLSAIVLKVISQSTESLVGVVALRLMSAAIGIGHLLLMIGCLRFLFPMKPRTQAIGFCIAAWMPMHVYINHYVTNEGLLAVVTTATLYACLRVLNERSISTKSYALVGACLGAALLTRFSALLVTPFVFGALTWQLWFRGERMPRNWMRSIGVTVGVCLLICGWYFVRAWIHFGKPVVGAWDPVVGHPWWQDEGYRTWPWFWRFGQAMVEPWYSSFDGFWDGIHATTWGDGLCGGASELIYRPPWNHHLMMIGYWISTVPALWIVTGAIVSLRKYFTRPSPQWLLVHGVVWGFAFAFIHMALVIPYYGEIKGFYGLLTILPLGALGAVGWEWFCERKTWLRWPFVFALGLWMLNVFGTYWIKGNSVDARVSRAVGLLADHRPESAARELTLALKSAPDHDTAVSLFANALRQMDSAPQAYAALELALAARPDSASLHLELAAILEDHGRLDQSIEHTIQATDLAPESAAAWWNLALRLRQAGRFRDAVFAYRQATRLAPYRFDLLSEQAWVLAASPDEEAHDPVEAMKIAAQACRMSRFESVQALTTMAVAYADAGRFKEAMTMADRALKKSADDADMSQLLARMIEQFRANRPWRDEK